MRATEVTRDNKYNSYNQHMQYVSGNARNQTQFENIKLRESKTMDSILKKAIRIILSSKLKVQVIDQK